MARPGTTGGQSVGLGQDLGAGRSRKQGLAEGLVEEVSLAGEAPRRGALRALRGAIVLVQSMSAERGEGREGGRAAALGVRGVAACASTI